MPWRLYVWKRIGLCECLLPAVPDSGKFCVRNSPPAAFMRVLEAQHRTRMAQEGWGSLYLLPPTD
jgi:hypothetical protein